MQFAKFFKDSKDLKDQKELQSASTLVDKSQYNIDLHPKYSAGTPGGKGGQFMPKGSADYDHAIKDAKIHAKMLADHIKEGGKDNDTMAKAIAGKISEHVSSAHEKGVNPEHIAQEITDAGLTQWQKRKHDLPLTAKEKDFTDKAMAAAMKLYNTKMAAKKLDDHKNLLAQAEAAKNTHGESSKEYKVLMSKASKAASKAMEYGKTPEDLAHSSQQATNDIVADKESKKKDLYNAALISAKNSHLGVQDDNHDQVHAAAFTAAKEHFSPEQLNEIQDKAVQDNNLKVAKGIANIANAKAYHAKYVQFKNNAIGSKEHDSYKRSAAEYKHHYNAGAEEHGLTPADKAKGVSDGYALHNASNHGVQVIAPTEMPKAQSNVAQPSVLQSSGVDHLAALDTPSKIKNAVYQSAHNLAAITSKLGAGNPTHEEAFNLAKSIADHASKNGIHSETIKQLQANGKEAHALDSFKLPFKGKSKNKLPLAAQSNTPQVSNALPNTPSKQEASPSNNHPEAPKAPTASTIEGASTLSIPDYLKSLDTPSKLKNAVYTDAHNFHSALKAGLPTSDYAAKLQAVADHAYKKLGNGMLEMSDKAQADVKAGVYKLPFKGKSKNKNKLPLAAQSKQPEVQNAPVNHYEGHPLNGTYLVSNSDTPEVASLKKKSFDAAYALSKVQHEGNLSKTSPESVSSKEANEALFQKTDFYTTDHVAEAGKSHFLKNATNTSNAAAANTATHQVTSSATPTEALQATTASATPATLTTSLAATPESKKVKQTKVYSPLPKGTEADPHGLAQLNTKQKAANALYAIVHKIRAAQSNADTDPATVTKLKLQGNAINNTFKAFVKTLKNTAANTIINKASDDFNAGAYALPNPLSKHKFEVTDADHASLAPTTTEKVSVGKIKASAKIPLSSIPKGTEGDPYGLKQLDTKQKVLNALYAIKHKQVLANKQGNPLDSDRLNASIEQLNAVSKHGKDMGVSFNLRHKAIYRAQLDASSPNGTLVLPHPQSKHLLYAEEGAKSPTMPTTPNTTDAPSAHPYENHPLKGNPLANVTDDPETANAKKEVFDSSFNLAKTVHTNPNDTEGTEKAVNALTTATNKFNSFGSHNIASALSIAGADAFHAKAKESQLPNQTIPSTVAPTTTPNSSDNATVGASLTPHSLPTTKQEAEDLNKTLAKNYYTLRKLHGGNNDNVDVKAAYDSWNKLKDHMKATLGHNSAYFSETSSNYKKEAESEYNTAAAAKLQEKQSALSNYKDVAEKHHILSLLKGEDHPDVIASKSGLNSAATLAKQHLSDQELQHVDLESIQNATSNIEKKKKEALVEIHDAAYKAYMAQSDKGDSSEEHLAASTNANNIADRHIAGGLISGADVANAMSDAKDKAEKNIKAYEAFKQAVGNPSAIAEAYDASAANYTFLNSAGKAEAEKIGSDLYASLPDKTKNALKSYTGNGYTNMNKALASETANADAKLIEEAIDKPLGKDMMIRRNMPQKWFLKAMGLATDTSTRTEMGNLSQEKLDGMVGKVYREPGFSSSSYDEHQSLMVSSTGSASGGLILKIRAKGDVAKGIFIDKHSSHSNEREIILQKGATYVVRKITKVGTVDGKFTYQADVDMIGHIKDKPVTA